MKTTIMVLDWGYIGIRVYIKVILDIVYTVIILLFYSL